jgi:hypothetical protein
LIEHEQFVIKLIEFVVSALFIWFVINYTRFGELFDIPKLSLLDVMGTKIITQSLLRDG